MNHTPWYWKLVICVTVFFGLLVLMMPDRNVANGAKTAAVAGGLGLGIFAGSIPNFVGGVFDGWDHMESKQAGN